MSQSILFDRHHSVRLPLPPALGCDPATTGNILHNLRIAWLCERRSGEPTYVALRLDKNAYRNCPRYALAHLTHRKVKAALGGLLDQGLVDLHIGWFDRRKGEGRVSRIRASQRLGRVLDESKDASPPVRLPGSPVIVRDAENRLAPPPNRATHARLEARATAINGNNLAHRVELPAAVAEALLDRKKTGGAPDACFQVLLVPALNETEPGRSCDLTSAWRLRRIFNNGRFDQGGRFYADAQCLPESARTSLLIDAEPVVELDYSALHPRWLYALEGNDCREDPYAAVGGMVRDDAKKVALICVNAVSRTSAARAIGKAKGRGEIASAEPARVLLAAFEAAHPRLARHFYSGVGLDLMWHDSQLAEAILLRFAALGEACLPVHDSFIARRGMEAELRRAMVGEYRKLVGFEPVIK
jgi:hypothetical protein